MSGQHHYRIVDNAVFDIEVELDPGNQVWLPALRDALNHLDGRERLEKLKVLSVTKETRGYTPLVVYKIGRI